MKTTEQNKRKSAFALAFARAVVCVGGRKSKGTRRSSRDGRGHKFKGRFQFNDVDEDKVARLARRKAMVAKHVAAVTPAMAIWMRVVTDYGKTIMMNADQFDAGGVQGVKSAVPHFG
jgi:hypothetical protein